MTTVASASEEGVLLVTFFLPMPEPLAVPDGSTFTYLTGEHPLLRGTAVTPVADKPPMPDSEGQLAVSLRFWRREVEPAMASDIRLLFDVAHAAVPSPLPKHPSIEGVEAPPLPKLVVEAAVGVPGRIGDVRVLHQAFEQALIYIQTFQRSYAIVSGRAVDLLTRETLPPMVPSIVRQLAPNDTVPLPGIYVLTTGGHLGEQQPLENDKLSLIASMSRPGVEAYTVSSFFELRRSARVALEKYGNYWLAITATDAAAEALLNVLLGTALWEEGLSPQDAAGGPFKFGLRTRLLQEYHGRFGGSWVLKTGSVVGDWEAKIARPRNRLVHGGHVPSEKEAKDAIAALRRLVKFVTDQLAAQAKRGRYPKTAILIAGAASLKERQSWTKKLEAIEYNDVFAEQQAWWKRFESQLSKNYKLDPS